MVIQMTRAQYEQTYGTAPSGTSVGSSSQAPIQMTRAQYEAKYGIPAQKRERMAQGLPIALRQDRAEPTKAGTFAREALRVPAMIASQLMAPTEKGVIPKDYALKTQLLGDVEPFGNVIGVGRKEALRTLGRSVGGGAELASYAVGGPEGAALVKGGYQGLKPFAQQVLRGAATEGLAGAAGGAGVALREGGDVGDVAKGALTGLGIGVGAGAVAPAIGATPKALRSAPGVISKKVMPQMNATEAVGQILQGKPKDIKQGVRALTTIDTKGVKTYDDLAKRIDEKIPELSEAVDMTLDSNTPIPLDSLTVKQATKSGREVSTNYVNQALDNLVEMYEATGDVLQKAEIEDLLEKARISGLTRKEINDISRMYGNEFGEKAFSKRSGEPLTSVNAQRYENIRSGLKQVARQGIGGEEAKLLDRQLSALLNVKKLVSKNAEKVNALKQKIEKRGLLEKAGRWIARAVDLSTGGLLRGSVGALFPSNVGLKTLNYLDLEKNLQRNLKVIERALEAGTDKEILDALKNVSRLPEKPTALNNGATPKTVKKSAISKELEPLAQEARKYKSAEEFKTNLTAKQLREFLNETTPEGTVPKTASAKATGARVRKEGDYLYAQDRDYFNALLSDINKGRNTDSAIQSQLTDIWEKANKGR